jgi:hypothetical protein
MFGDAILTLYDVLIEIHNNLEIALEMENRLIDEKIISTLELILEIAYKHNASEQAILLTDLLYSANHIIMGVFFKAREAFPSKEMMKITFLLSIS